MSTIALVDFDLTQLPFLRGDAMNDDPTLLDEVRDYLSQRSTLTVATVDASGKPLAAALFFAADRSLRLYVASNSTSRHARAFECQNHVAITVQAETWTWPAITGVQIEGTVRRAGGSERTTAMAVYSAKFPFVSALGARLDESTFYCIEPHWVRWIDNRQGFGHRLELHLAPERPESAAAPPQSIT